MHSIGDEPKSPRSCRFELPTTSASSALVCFDEVERKVREVGRKFDPELPAGTPEKVRRQIEFLSSGFVVQMDPLEPLPAHTRDPNDDYVVEMAFRAEAAAVVSEDRDIVPADGHIWRDAHRKLEIPALRVETFIADMVNNSGFDIDDVDFRLYETIIRPLPGLS
jgi:predicted nucleic acid-binding protein